MPTLSVGSSTVTSPKSLDIKLVRKLCASVIWEMFSITPKEYESSICLTFTISNACNFKSASVQNVNLSIVVGTFSVAMTLPIGFFMFPLLKINAKNFLH